MFTGSKRIKKPFLYSGFILLAVSLAVLAWCYWPLPAKQQSLALSPTNLQALNPGIQLPAFLLQENRRLVLSYPTTLRQGETGRVTLRWDLSIPSPGSLAAAAGPSVLVETRLDLLGIFQNPAGSIDAPLFPGQALVLQWQINGVQAGLYSGTVWSYLNPSPASDNSSTGQQTSDAFQPVAAQDIEVQIISLFGLDFLTAKWMDASGLVLAVGLMLYAFLGGSKRTRRRKKKVY
jgi:hypothetical protein